MYQPTISRLSTNKMSEDDHPSVARQTSTPSFSDSTPKASYALPQAPSIATSNLELPATFALFSHLPTELRRVIWKHALPPGHRVLTVGLTCLMRERKWHWELSVLRCFEEQCRDPVDTSMLVVCKESRDEYLKANPKFLPERSGGKFYYNPASTLIHIVPCSYGVSYELLSMTSTSALRPAPWFADIELLAIHLDSNTDRRNGTFMREWQQYAFVNSKEILWIDQICFGWSCRSLWPELCTKTMVVLEMYKSLKELSDQESRLTIFDGGLDRFMDI
jgi:hypothetical protein